MRYKIQVPACFGWADLKVSEDDCNYNTEFFETKAEATAELKTIKEDIPDFEGRVVLETTPQDVDIYD